MERGNPLMLHISRPWSNLGQKMFGVNDCLLSELSPEVRQKSDHAVLLRSSQHGNHVNLVLHPYPRAGFGRNPDRQGFPKRPPKSKENLTEEEARARILLKNMNQVLARVQELGEALDDPLHVWPRLKEAWLRAENEDDPRMAEIVKQAREILPRLRELEPRIRRVLRRTRERIPLDRVQEMDRASMRWLVRQPGRTIAERAGASQRILATVRRENFDTAENRVLHAYTILASDVARQWMREHPKAKNSRRYEQVGVFSKFCRGLAKVLVGLDIRVAEASISPNYVLMQDGNYKAIYEAWVKLLQQQKAEDDLWAWQAETWTDFCVLAIILALHDVAGAQLIAQSPIFWRSEASLGRWFEQDNPIAVFWLKDIGRVVEISCRPKGQPGLISYARAHVGLRISDFDSNNFQRTVAVWTPHTLGNLDVKQAVIDANQRILDIQKLPNSEILRHGIILTPSNGILESELSESKHTRVQGVPIDPVGAGLKYGFDLIRDFVTHEIYAAAQ